MTGPEPAPFQTSVDHPLPGAVVVTVHGDVDLETAPHLRAVIAEQMISPLARLIVDLNGITFLGSAGMAVLIEAHTSWPDLQIVCSDPRPLRAIQISGLGDWLRIADSVTSALGPDATGEPLAPT